MEKMIWAKPELNEVAFAANEYVAACGDSGTVYKFICDARGGDLYYYRNHTVSYDANGNSNAPTNWSDWSRDDRLLGWYTPCEETHEAESTDMFYWGYVDYNNNETHNDNETVIVWRGPRNDNGHATALLDMDEWETAKS